MGAANAGDAARATLRIAFATHADAEAAQAVLAPDNGEHLQSRVEGRDLVLTAAAATPMGLLRTLDDALACLRATGVP